MDKKPAQSNYRKKRQQNKSRQCHCCGQTSNFCWHCRCGFSICQDCLLENFWGMSCNGITWECPDCGQHNGLGNQ